MYSVRVRCRGVTSHGTYFARREDAERERNEIAASWASSTPCVADVVPAPTDLSGATRTCVEYMCVEGRGSCKPGKPGCREAPGGVACKKGYVLRCAEYVDEAALPPYVGQRKGWPQYIHAAASTNRTLRAMYPPAVKPAKFLRAVSEYRKNVSGQPGGKKAKRKKKG